MSRQPRSCLILAPAVVQRRGADLRAARVARAGHGVESVPAAGAHALSSGFPSVSRSRKRRCHDRPPKHPRPDRPHADAAHPPARHERLRAVPEAGKHQSRRLDQGPHRAVDDRGGRAGREDQTRRHPGRRHRRQHRHRPGAGGAGQGLPADPRGARQDEPREDLQPQGDGGRGAADPLGRGQGSSAVLPGHGRAHRARNPGRVFHQPVRQPRQPACALRNHRPGNPRTDGRAHRCLRVRLRLLGHHDRPVALLRRALPGHPAGPGRSGRLDPHPVHQRGRAQHQVGELDGRGHRRGLPAADFRLLAGEEGLRDPGQGKFPHRARAAGEGRRPRRLDHRHAAGRGAALVPRADRAQARGDAGARHRQQIPLQDVQRLLDAGQRLHRARAARRPARPDRAPLQPARHRGGGTGRPADRGLSAHEALRREPAAGDGRRPHRRHPG